MVAIVSGNSVGLGQSFVPPMGERGNLGQPSSGKTGEQTYVNVATGNVVIQDGDTVMVGRGEDVALLRTYNSQGKLSDDNGDAWWLNGYRHVADLSGSINTAGSSVYRAGQDGSAIKYDYDSTRQLYVATQGSGQFDTLSSDGTNWTWTNATTHQTETYQSGNGYTWKLATASDTNGNVTTYSYNGELLSKITDANGESVEFIYTGNNLSQERIVAADGKITSNTHYSYDTQNRLSQVLLDLSPEDASITDGKVYATSYTYVGASNLIDSITQTDGSYQKFTYVTVDGESRVASITDAYSNVTKFDYDTVNRQTKVTDAFGNVTVYTLTADKRFDSVTAPAANGQTSTQRYGYDGAGNITSLTDALGNVTSYTYDTAGHLLSQTDAAGNRTDNTYDANGDLLLSTLTPAASANQANGPQTTRFVYDDKHNLRYQISANGAVSEQRYDSNGQKTTSIHYTSVSYPVSGLAASASLTLSQMQSWANAQPANAITRSDYGYNTRGQLTSTTSYAKVNADGTGLADGSQSITQYSYDVTGNLLFSIDALGNQTSYTYDGLNRQLSTTDALQKTSYTEYDDANHKIVQHNASGRIDTRVYDNQGHLLSSTLGGELTTSYGYDALGRLVYAKDPTGVEQLHIYDAAGNLQADVNGQGEVTQYIYNVLGQRVQTIARANTLTGAQFQQLKDQVVQTGNASSAPANVSVIPVTASASDMIVRTLYDNLGRVAKTISPLGEVTELQYNAAGNLVATIQRANTINPSSVGINATAQDVQVTADAKDRSSLRYYDQDQKLIGTVDAEGGIVEYRYDSAGRQTTTIAYATQNKAAQVDSQFSALITQNPSTDAISYNFYNAENQLIGTVNAEGYATEHQYNLDGQLTQTTRYNNKANSVSPGVAWDSVKPVADATADLVSKQTYDVLGRTKINTEANGSITTSFYDDNTGQLIQQTANLGGPQNRFVNHKYDQYGRVTGDLSSKGGWIYGANVTDAGWATYGVQYTYDTANRRTSSTDQNGHRTLYYYDQAGHLTQTINALGEVTENRYNHLGQLIDTIRYGTRLAGVASLTGGLVTSSLTQSLAAIANNQLDSVQHLSYDLDGRVASMTDANGNVTTYRYDQFGERIGTTSPVTDTDNVESTTNYNKLGQVTDTVQDASGIKQTIHTDYDAFGRAIRSVDANGNVKTQKFDRLGRTVEVADQTSGYSNKTTYNAFDQVLTLTDAKGNVSTYAYKNNQWPSETKITSAEGNATTTRVNPYGQISVLLDGKGNQTSYTYDRDGNLTSKWSSDGVGNLYSLVEFNTYDNADRLTSSKDANGNITTYGYDDANRLISKTLTVAGGAPLVTTYVYDAKGQQVEITDPNNVKTKLEYDLNGQLIRQTVDPDGLKLVTEYSYDKRGKTLQVTQKGSTQDLVQRYVFDKLGRRIEEYTGTTLTRRYQYDANNNVISSTDADGNTTRFAYDSQNRQILVLDAAGGMQRTVYDENGHVKSVRRYASAVSLTGLSAHPTRAMLEALVPAETAQDRFSTNYYDKDGRVTSTVDALGGVVSYVYDASNNVVKKTSGDGVNPANDRTQWFAYDGMNRLTVSIAADGSVISNTYDGNSNITSTTAYANRINTANLVPGATSQTYLNQVQVNAQQDRTERRAYDAANRMIYSVDAQGYVTQNVYVGTHLKVTTQYDTPVVVSSSSADVIQAALISSADHDRTVTYDYDPSGHLIRTTDALGLSESYEYNVLGQKISFTNKSGALWTYTYDQAGRLKTETSPPVTVSRVDYNLSQPKIASSNLTQIVTWFDYDLTGNLITRTEGYGSPDERTTRYEYDAMGRQVKTIYPPVQVYTDSFGPPLPSTLFTEVTYDTLGNAVRSLDVGGKYSYKVYDQAGHVRFDIDAAGYITEYKRNAFGEVETLIRYASDRYNSGSNTAPVLPQFNPVNSGQDRQIKTTYDQRGQISTVTESMFYGSDGVHAEYQAKTTSNTYNAFGELIKAAVGRNIYDTSGNLQQSGVDLAVTRYFWDQRGQQIASLDAESYLTRQAYDAVGNLVLHTEFANRFNNWSDDGNLLPSAEINETAGNDDRSIRYEYDKDQRKISETRLNVEFAQLSGIGRTDANKHGAIKTSFGYDHVGNLLSTIEQEIDDNRLGNSSSQSIPLITRVSLNEYDALGRITATTTPASGADNQTMYVEFKRDAYGNAVAQISSVIKQKSATKLPELAYLGTMRSGQVLKEGEALYSANGRFQLAMQIDGNVAIYDSETGTLEHPALIWSSQTQASGNNKLTLQNDGNLVMTNGQAILWQSATHGAGVILHLKNDGNLELIGADGQVRWQSNSTQVIQISSAHSIFTQYDTHGNSILSIDADNHSARSEYDAFGRLASQYRTVTDVDGVSTTAVSVTHFDALGRVIETIQPGSNGANTAAGAQELKEVRTQTSYNAFGEMTAQSVNGVQTQYSDYDNAGHVWRTNVGGTDKILLNDYMGRVTQQITSIDQDLKTYTAASAAAAAQVNAARDFVSSNVRYDRLGHVTERQIVNGSDTGALRVEVESAPISFIKTGSIESSLGTDGTNPGDPKGGVPPNGKGLAPWTGINAIQLTLPKLSEWGYGDVKISVQFRTTIGTGGVPAKTASYEQVFTAQETRNDQSTGDTIELRWNNRAEWKVVAQDNITDIVVSKKDALGNWVTLDKLSNNPDDDVAQSASNSAVVKISAPNDISIQPVLSYRQVGNANWLIGNMTNFGDTYIFNPVNGKSDADAGGAQGVGRSLAEGQYEYKIEYIKSNESIPIASSQGTLVVGYSSERIKAAQLYVALYNRAPTYSEMESAAVALKSLTLAQFAQGMLDHAPLAGKTGKEILDAIYTGALGRAIDSEGQTYWLAQWDNGSANAHGSVVADIINGNASYTGDNPLVATSSKLFNNKVSVAVTYGFQLKGNDLAKATAMINLVTADDVNAALAVAAVGTSVTDAYNRMQLTRLYILINGRIPDSAGLDYWANDLKKNPGTLIDVAGSILQQSELNLTAMSNADVVNTIFDRVLTWNNSSEKAAFVTQLDSLGTNATVAQKANVILSLIDHIVNNTDASFDHRQVQQLLNNRVNVGLLYADFVKGNDPEFEKTLNSQITATDTLTALDALYGKADTAQNKELMLARAYVLVFNRAPDVAGFQFWLGQWNNGGSLASTLTSFLVNKLPNVSNLDLVKGIFNNSLASNGDLVTAENSWVAQLNQVGQPGGSASKGEVLERMINALLSSASDSGINEFSKQVYNLKVATALNYVKFGGNDEFTAASAIASAQDDVVSMNASAAVIQAQNAASNANAGLAAAQAAVAATDLAAAAIALESSAAQLAYAKALAASTLADYQNAESALLKAKSDLEAISAEKNRADHMADDAAALVHAADNALSIAIAAVETDASLEKQAALVKAQSDLREAQIAAASALTVSNSKKDALAVVNANISNINNSLTTLQQAADNAAANSAIASANYQTKLNEYQIALANSQSTTAAKQAADSVLGTITNSNQDYVAQIHMLYSALLFREPTPEALKYWLDDMTIRHNSMIDVAANMYRDPSSGLSSQDPKSLFVHIFNNALDRYDAGVDAGATYWAQQLINASSVGTAKGQVFVAFINGVLSENGNNQYGLEGKTNFQRHYNTSFNNVLWKAMAVANNANASFQSAQTSVSNALSSMNYAKSVLDSTPDSITAKKAYDQAVDDLRLANIALGQISLESSRANQTYSDALSAVNRIQTTINNLSPTIGGATSPNDLINDLAAKQTAMNLAENLSKEANTAKTNAQTDRDRIQYADQSNLKQLLQLYVMLFNRTDPKSDGLSYWLDRLKSGMSLNDIATSMYNDPLGNPALSSKSSTTVISDIYRLSLNRNDNDIAGINYWASQLDSAASSQKGQMLLGMMWSIQNDPTNNASALEGRRIFNDKVAQGMSRAFSNANAALTDASVAADKAATAAGLASNAYLTALKASGTSGTSDPGSTSIITSNNLVKVLQIFYLLTGKQTTSATDLNNVNIWVNSLNTNQETLASVAGKIYLSINGDVTPSASLISAIYSGAMHRTTKDVAGEAYWVNELNNANASGNLAQRGQVFLNIIDGFISSSLTDAERFNSRKFFDQGMQTLTTAFSTLEKFAVQTYKDISSGLNLTVDSAQKAYAAAGQTIADTAKVDGMVTAPAVSASTQQTQTAQLYALMFNRAPENAGLEYWSPLLQSQSVALTAQQMLDGSLGADIPSGLSDAGFVDRLYANLGNVDTARINQHKTDLTQHLKSRGQVVAEILTETISTQSNDIPGLNRQQVLANKTSVGLIYALTLRGDSAVAARSLFTNVTADNASGGISAAIATAPEVYTRSQVAALYLMMFGHDPDLGGFNHWADRAPTPDAGSTAWTSFVHDIMSGDATHSLESNNLNDTQFIVRLFNNAFGHDPDVEGLKYWATKLGSCSRAEVIVAILTDTLNSAGNNSSDANIRLQAQLNQKTFTGKLAATLNQLVALEQNALANVGQADQGKVKALLSAASIAAGNAIAADQIALKALSEVGASAIKIPLADTSWMTTIVLNKGTSSATHTERIVVNQTSDRWGNVTSISDARNTDWVTRYKYDSDNHMIESRQASGASGDIVLTQAYNSLGQHVGSVDGNGNLIYRIFDANGNVLEERHPDGGVQRNEYDGFGNRLKHIDEEGNLTSYTFDNLGQITSQSTSPVSVFEVTGALETARGDTRLVNANQILTTAYAYDELGRRIKVTDALGGVQRTWYDLRGNVVRADTFSDTRNTVSSNSIAQTIIAYDAQNHKVSEIDANHNRQTWVYDPATGRLIQHTDLGQHITDYKYNGLGLIQSEKGSNYGKNIAYSYNTQGLISQIDDVGTSTMTSYQYDAAGNRVTERVLQKVKGIDVALQDNHLAYDQVGRLAYVEDGRYHLSYQYDHNNNRIMLDSSYITDVRSSYDTNGNLIPNINGNIVNSVINHEITYNAYDSMNRQVIVDGTKVVADANNANIRMGDIGIIAGGKGHVITYDHTGHRLSDTSYGTKLSIVEESLHLPATGIEEYVDNPHYGQPYWITDKNGSGERIYEDPSKKVVKAIENSLTTETYDYDRAGRLSETRRDGLVIDHRQYNAIDQVVRSGVLDDLRKEELDNQSQDALKAAGIGLETQINRYQTNNVNQLDRQQILTGGSSYTGFVFAYDNVGNMTQYNQDTNIVVKYSYDDNNSNFDQYQLSQIQGTRGAGPGTTTNRYDVNGHLINASQDSKDIRDFRVDSAGHILRKEQRYLADSDRIELTTSLLVNDQIIGSSSNDATTDSINQSYVKQSSITGNGPSVYRTQSGDTLSGIAKAVWGDASLWYLLADANGLASDSTEPLSSGSNLLIPARNTSGHNNTGTLRPYNPSKIVGDLTPTLPMPQGQDGGCGGVGQIVMIAIAIAVTVYTAGAMAGEANFFGTMTNGATALTGGGAAAAGTATSTIEAAGFSGGFIAGATGSIASQLIGNAIGATDGFSWKSVALSGLSGGIASGVAEFGQLNAGLLHGGDLVPTIGRAVAGNLISQGIGIATGMQPDFSWKGVAASAVGAGVGQQMNNLLGNTSFNDNLGNWGGAVARSALSGFTAGVAANIVHGGRVEVSQIAVDAFGNSLGQSLAEANSGVEEAQPKKSFSEQIQENKERNTPSWAKAWYANNSSSANSTDTSESFYEQNMARIRREAAELPYGEISSSIVSDAGYSQRLVGGGGAQFTAPDIVIRNSGSVAEITARQGQPRIYNEETGTMGWAVDMPSAPEMRPLIDANAGGQNGADGLLKAQAESKAFYENSKDTASNGFSYVGYHFGGLLSDVGYEFAQGARGLYRLATDSNARTQAMNGVKQIIENPMLVMNAAKEGYSDFMNKPFGEQADSVFKFGTSLLAGAGAGKILQVGATPVLRGGSWVVEESYVKAQDYAVKTWLRSQSNDLLGGSWQQVYDSASDGSRRLGFSFGKLDGWRAVNHEGSAKFGNFFSLERPYSPLDAIENSALIPEWGNKATELYQVSARPGFYFKGTIAPQYSDQLGRTLSGGNTQIFQTKVINGITADGRPNFVPTWGSVKVKSW